MNTPINLARLGRNVVYVKPVDVADLPEEVQAQAEGRERLFAVHNSDGRQLALVIDEKLAFALAREHDMVPMTIH
ncbi:DUF1150 family protein [Pseudoroseicyclus sp. CXY001]|uniref:DUF1150 family protein n=1 Tax=Pseudoroseicyclus sp. CXY001 TaxID=3242492 RepID=UPI003570EFF8